MLFQPVPRILLYSFVPESVRYNVDRTTGGGKLRKSSPGVRQDWQASKELWISKQTMQLFTLNRRTGFNILRDHLILR